MLALEADFIARRVGWSHAVARTFLILLEVTNSLVSEGEGRLPAGHEPFVGLGMLEAVLGESREHDAATSSTSATADVRNLHDRPQLRNLSLDDFHPLVGDPGEAVTGLGLHGF